MHEAFGDRVGQQAYASYGRTFSLKIPFWGYRVLTRTFHVCEAFICEAFKGATEVDYCKPLTLLPSSPAEASEL